MGTAMPLTRDELTAELLAALGQHLDTTTQLVTFAQGIADALGGDALAVLNYLATRYEHTDRLVRLYHQALTIPPAISLPGAADGD
ncbi:hypothetical protein OH799_01370 [Nocardia sp. NBC_00881]|uniref:hypothetical protein n=1 Tax=Nocardia sp. NBC_00881 TaxID=2975995 RepID=UPI00386CF9DF|nr:hypothetical protein OH799_01370 [Nocardia sp. NBC_00881]